jgi:hypothetical protein
LLGIAIAWLFRKTNTVLSSLDCRVTDARQTPRSSLYLGAALYCDGSSTAVRIRNMSPGGALLEGAVLPEVGALVQLVRGSLIIHGLVIWCSAGRCGLKFSGLVAVEQWRACPSNVEQQRVDEVVRLVKAGAVPLPVATVSEHKQRAEAAEAGSELPQDLRRVCELLEQLGDVLACDPDVISRHGTALQNLDIAIQLIAGVQEVVTGPNNWETDTVKLAGLRRNADQVLLGQS